MLNRAADRAIDLGYTTLIAGVLAACALGQPGICNENMAKVTSDWETFASSLLGINRIPGCAFRIPLPACLQFRSEQWALHSCGASMQHAAPFSIPYSLFH